MTALRLIRSRATEHPDLLRVLYLRSESPEMNLATDEKNYIQVVVNGQVESAQVRSHHLVCWPA